MDKFVTISSLPECLPEPESDAGGASVTNYDCNVDHVTEKTSLLEAEKPSYSNTDTGLILVAEDQSSQHHLLVHKHELLLLMRVIIHGFI